MMFEKGSGLNEIALSRTDVSAAFSLSSSVGWNQTRDDWELFVARARATGLKDAAGRLQATIVSLPFGDEIAWLAMLIVSDELRGQGIGSSLLNAALAECDGSRRTAGLDATPSGEPLYLARGFEPTFELVRVEIPGGALRRASGGEDHPTTKPAVPAGSTVVEAPASDRGVVESFLEKDRDTLGFERQFVLRDFLSRKASRLFVHGESSGFLLVRSGRTATQLGPLYAERDGAAIDLLTTAIGTAHAGRCFIDVPSYQTGFLSWLEKQGGKVQRPLVRMFRTHHVDTSEKPSLYAVAGPAFG